MSQIRNIFADRRCTGFPLENPIKAPAWVADCATFTLESVVHGFKRMVDRISHDTVAGIHRFGESLGKTPDRPNDAFLESAKIVYPRDTALHGEYIIRRVSIPTKIWSDEIESSDRMYEKFKSLLEDPSFREYLLRPQVTK